MTVSREASERLAEARRWIIRALEREDVAAPSEASVRAAVTECAVDNDIDLLLDKKFPGVLTPDIIGVRTQRARALVDMAADVCDRAAQGGLNLLPVKTFPGYPAAGDDMDLVAVNVDTLRELRVACEGLGLVYYPSRSEIKEPLKRFYLAPGTNFHTHPRFHMHLTLSWYGVEYIGKEGVWERRAAGDAAPYPFAIPAPEDDLLIRIAHGIFENRKYSLADALAAKQFFDAKGDAEILVNRAEEFGWGTACRAGLERLCSWWAQESAHRPIPVSLNIACTAPAYARKFVSDVRRRRSRTGPTVSPARAVLACVWPFVSS